MIDGGICAGADEGEERRWVIATVESSLGELSSMLAKIRLRHFESVPFETKARGQRRANPTQWRHD
jgi:hypothetical protein